MAVSMRALKRATVGPCPFEVGEQVLVTVRGVRGPGNGRARGVIESIEDDGHVVVRLVRVYGYRRIRRRHTQVEPCPEHLRSVLEI